MAGQGALRPDSIWRISLRRNAVGSFGRGGRADRGVLPGSRPDGVDRCAARPGDRGALQYSVRGDTQQIVARIQTGLIVSEVERLAGMARWGAITPLFRDSRRAVRHIDPSYGGLRDPWKPGAKSAC